VEAAEEQVELARLLPEAPAEEPGRPVLTNFPALQEVFLRGLTVETPAIETTAAAVAALEAQDRTALPYFPLETVSVVSESCPR
jgi:hypothetical protein